MSPADVAAAFEDGALGTAIACVWGAVVVVLYLRLEWIVSKADREQRQQVK